MFLKFNGYVFFSLMFIFLLVADSPSYSFVLSGKGCSSAYHIDSDCDSYGVGTGYVIGPDADDTDPTINTTATVEAAYGSITSGIAAQVKDNLLSFLEKARGYDSIQELWFIATDGSDNSGVVNDYSKPFATFSGVRSSGLSAGDLVLYRGGSYSHQIYTVGLDGSSGSPIIVMSFPGELAIFNHSSTKIYQADDHYWTFDTFQLGIASSDTGGNGYECKGCQNVEVRYVECIRNNLGSRLMAGNITNEDFVWENCVVSLAYNSHNMYWGGTTGCARLTVRDSITHSNNSPSEYSNFYINGRCDILVLENSIFHSGAGDGISIKNGTQNGTIQNNLIFNNNKYPVKIEYYGFYTSSRPTKDNLFINNTIWVGRYNNGHGSSSPNQRSCVSITNWRDPGYGDDEPLSGNDFINNIMISYGGAIFVYGEAGLEHYNNTAYNNNVFYRLSGDELVAKNGSTEWDLSEFESNVLGASNNKFENASFKDVSVDYNLEPGSFDFDLISTSLAINFGTSTSAPAYDLRDYTRSLSIPDTGCYESPYTQPPVAPTGLKRIQ